jgi:hypothetical protein
MPERIATADIVALDPETLETSDDYPGAYGFYVRLSRDPGPEWAAEFDGAYGAATRSAKPPILFRGDTLCVYYLPLYDQELPEFLQFLEGIVAETNRSVERRNSVLPDDSSVRERFRSRLSTLSEEYKNKR